MSIRTVGGLKEELEKNGLTPEEFAPHVKISSMTLRRLLKRKPQSAIPEKYHASLDLLYHRKDQKFLNALSDSGSFSNDSFKKLLGEVERDGRRFTDLSKLAQDTKIKLKDRNIAIELRDLVRQMLKTVLSSEENWKYRALCVGALLYFINPFDLIPDSIPVVGYLDDFAVLTLVAGIIAKKGLSKKRKPLADGGANVS